MDFMEGMMIMVNTAIVFLFFAWVFKVILEWRKIKHKNELNKQLLEKFEKMTDLKEFFQTENGVKFFQTLTVNGGNTMDKVINALKSGIIMMFLGGGFWVLSGVFAEDHEAFTALGVIIVALGLGFLVSSVVSFILSKKWGMVEPK